MIIIAVIINRGRMKKPKNIDSISTIKAAITESIKIQIIQALKIFNII